VLRTAHHFGASLLAHGHDRVSRPHRPHRSGAFLHKPWPRIAANDTELPHSLGRSAGQGNAAAPEVKTQQVRIIGARLRQRWVAGAAWAGSSGAITIRMVAPVAQGRAADACGRAHSVKRESPLYERKSAGPCIGTVHASSITQTTDIFDKVQLTAITVPRVGFEPTLCAF
jgi:hypothetical protein